jgi:hypothetical protein
MAPRETIIMSAEDPSSVAHDLYPTICTEVTPPLNATAAAFKGVKFIAAWLRKLDEWRAFFLLLSTVSIAIKPKLLTHSGLGNVSTLHSDIPHDRAVSALGARATIRRITRASYLCRHRLSAASRCSQCGLTMGFEESLDSHAVSVQCPNGGMRHMMHARLVGAIRSIVRDIGLPDMEVITKTRGLRTRDATRPGDVVVVLDFFAERKHVVIDAVATTVYRNTVL